MVIILRKEHAQKSKFSKPKIICLGSAALAIIIGLSIYTVTSQKKYHSVNNFPRNVTIDNIDVGGKNVNQAFNLLKESLNKENIYLYESSNSNKAIHTIKGAGNQYYILNRTEINKMLLSSHSNNYPKSKFTLNTSKNKYNKYIDNKINSFALNKNRTKGIEALLIKANDKFEVTKESKPNTVDLETLKSNIKNKKITDNDDTNSYYLNDYYTKFPSNYLGASKLQNLASKYNTFITPLVISKTANTASKTMSKHEVMKSLTLNENNLDTKYDEVHDWVKNNFSMYSKVKSYGNTVSTPDGSKHSYDLGKHGEEIDYDKLTKDIEINLLKESRGKITPEIKKVDTKREINYVGVNVGTQKEYVIKNGKVVVDTGIMSGMTGQHATPTGEFKIAYKVRNAHLKGFNDNGAAYDQPVDYWEPFNADIGFHDSPWQPSMVYGNPSYLSAYGSHGCINNPPSIMGKVFDNTTAGETVFVY